MNNDISNAVTKSSSSYIIGFLLLGVIFSVLIYLFVRYMGTRDSKQGSEPRLSSTIPQITPSTQIEHFYGGAISGSSALPCGRMSSEAEQLYAMFNSKKQVAGEKGSTDLNDLKNLLSKLTCLKHDLINPVQTITAVKGLGFATHMDIQPVADLTGRCFSKTIPEREIDIQFIKWRDFGLDMIRRLCTTYSINENEVMTAEKLFLSTWTDVQDIAHSKCLSCVPVDTYKVGRHDPSANTPNELQSLRPYDGLY